MTNNRRQPADGPVICVWSVSLISLDHNPEFFWSWAASLHTESDLIMLTQWSNFWKVSMCMQYWDWMATKRPGGMCLSGRKAEKAERKKNQRGCWEAQESRASFLIREPCVCFPSSSLDLRGSRDLYRVKGDANFLLRLGLKRHLIYVNKGGADTRRE